MERNATLDDSISLIDFSSPISKRTFYTPLIPVPNDINRLSVSPSNSNPFDIMVKQTISPEIIDNDPFECASKTRQTNLNNSKYKSFERRKNSQLDELVVNQDINQLNENINMEQETLTEENKQNCDNRLSVETEKTNDLFNISTVDKEVTTLPSKSSVLHRCGDSSLSQVSGDFSSEEGIKATIAKRVDKCIQKVLSNSMIKKKGDEKQCSGFKYNRKSASFTTTSTSNKLCDRLNKSCSDPAPKDDSFIINTPESSICSCDTPLSFLSGEDLQQNESMIPTTENDEIFQEANKLARTFSKIAESFSKNTEGTENNDDLLSCEPQWLFADSSEDEDEKLKKDPALNIRVSFTTPKSQNQTGSDTLSALKNRLRQSFSHLQVNDNQKESSFKRSFSFGSKPLIAPVMPNIAPSSVPVILDKHDDNVLKLKKKPLAELRRGPMRAVMPVQNMAKESLTSGVPVQSAANRVTSPIRRKSSAHIMISPIKDISQINMCPVASSTPNKCSPATTPIMVPQNKRHSLGSKSDNRKSRNPLVESGFRQRSSSANSSIPTPLGPPGRGLGPKSKSNLIKSSITAKINAHPEKDSQKKLTRQVKSNFNPNALNEVKPKSVQPNRVKSAVNALSNVITGKSRRAAVKGKENRFPA